MTSSRPVHLESYGTHCQFGPCNLADFLPFVCPHCHLSFCSAHRTPSSHSCPSYDESSADVRATPCPLCGVAIPVAVVQNETVLDLDTAMEVHLDSGKCESYNEQSGLVRETKPNQTERKGRRRTGAGENSNSNTCRYARCSARCWVEIRCDQCGGNFCPSHREPRSHKCGGASPNTSSSASSWTSANPVTQTHTQTQTQPPRLSPVIPLRAAAAAAPLSSTSSGSGSGSGSNNSKPFHLPISVLAKTPFAPGSGSGGSGSGSASASRRAARERESAALALKNRAKKGWVPPLGLVVVGCLTEKLIFLFDFDLFRADCVTVQPSERG